MQKIPINLPTIVVVVVDDDDDIIPKNRDKKGLKKKIGTEIRKIVQKKEEEKNVAQYDVM
jgi:hypothetical protein